MACGTRLDPQVRQLLTRRANRGDAGLEEQPDAFTWQVGEWHAYDLFFVLRENDGRFYGLIVAVLEPTAGRDELDGFGIDELEGN